MLAMLGAAGAPGQEMRALWVVRDNIASPEAVSEVVAFAADRGFNLLFVQVRGRGDAYYQSYFVPGPESCPLIPSSFDPLREITRLAHERGIKVHAWVNAYLAASLQNQPSNPEHLYNAHPSWFMVSARGQRMGTDPASSFAGQDLEGAYLSPGLPEVRDYLTRVVTEIATGYDVDGIHLDYIRYPGREYDFNDAARARFQGIQGVDPVALYLRGDAVDPTLKLLDEWCRFRVTAIDDQVRSISRRIKLTGKPIRLSAAVKPDPSQAYYEFGQNWPGWLAENLVDFVVPMYYVPETAKIEAFLNGLPPGIGPERVVAGLGAHKLTPDLLRGQIALTRRLGLDGYCIFSYSELAGNPGFDSALKTVMGGR